MPNNGLQPGVPDHRLFCAESRKLYVDTRDPIQGALDWKEALWEARSLAKRAFRASDYLRDTSAALQDSGGHMLVFRHLLAPPISQDQFKLVCPSWPKSSEKKCRPVGKEAADAVAASIVQWRAARFRSWLDANRRPTRAELTSAFLSLSSLIAQQRVATARRNRLANEQEQAAIAALVALGWNRLPSKMIDKRADVPARHFMHKTRFASSKKAHQEVDIACGLRDGVVLALECKVTNDDTNSVKRINDVMKKATAWKDRFGVFVRPAALLQGVMKFSDVEQLLDANIAVFWTHRLDLFSAWLSEQA